MIAEFFILGGIWWWFLTVAIFFLLVWEIAGEKVIAAFFTLGLYLGLIHLFGNASIFDTIGKNPALIYIGVPAYFIVGTGWGFIKWFLYIKRKILDYKETRQSWLQSSGVNDATLNTPIPDNLKESWVIRVPNFYAVRHKNKIITWMAFWPLSMIWSFIDEPWRYIYNFCIGLLQKIADKVYKSSGIEQDHTK
jgi:hypothetical protein